MADIEQQDDDLNLDLEIEGDEDTQAEGVKQQGPENNDDATPIVIEIDGEEPAAEQDTPVIRQMREELRRTKRELAEYKGKQQPQDVQVGDKPTLEGCDYDEERFETELDAWKERKRAADRVTEERAEQERKSAEMWTGIENRYRQKAAALGVPDYEQKEQAVSEAIPDLVLRGVKAYCEDPAKVIAALGSNPNLLSKIADEQDPIKAVIMLSKLEDKMTVTRKRQIEPDRPVRGSAPVSATSVSKEEARLEKEAERTNDYTKLMAFRRQQRREGKERQTA